MSYQGPATLITGDGAEFDVDADLYVDSDGGMKTWLGAVTVAADTSGPALLAVERLRLPDGREGRIIVSAVTVGSGLVDVQGAGPAPWLKDGGS